MEISDEMKMLAVVGCLPVIADFLDDLKDKGVFQHQLKKAVSRLIEENNKMLFNVSNGIDPDAAYQQNDIEMWFRQQIKENFKDEI